MSTCAVNLTKMMRLNIHQIAMRAKKVRRRSSQKSSSQRSKELEYQLRCLASITKRVTSSQRWSPSLTRPKSIWGNASFKHLCSTLWTSKKWRSSLTQSKRCLLHLDRTSSQKAMMVTACTSLKRAPYFARRFSKGRRNQPLLKLMFQEKALESLRFYTTHPVQLLSKRSATVSFGNLTETHSTTSSKTLLSKSSLSKSAKY